MNNKLWMVIFLIITASLLFVSCKDSGAADSSGNVSEDELLTFAQAEGEEIRVVYPLQATDLEIASARAVVAAINGKYKANAKIYDDYNKADPYNENKVVNDNLEILVAYTNRIESETAYESLQYDTDWGVCVKNNKLIIAASSQAGLDRAVNYFVETVLKNAPTEGFSVSCNLAHFQRIENNSLLKSVMSEYTLICSAYADERVVDAVNGFKDKLGGYSDFKLSLKSDKTAAAGKEIIVGDTNRAVPASAIKLSYYDYFIRDEENSIVVSAGSSIALSIALEKLADMILYQEYEGQHLCRFEEQDTFNSLAGDINQLTPAWKDTITVPSWMTDFNEKLYAITNPNGRLMSMAHRGDTYNYPECSLEGFISAIMLGADIIETDARYSKDGYIMVLHDDTLERTTDYNSKRGKNGLPSSANLSDWTYSELCQLRLLDNNGKATKYRIPTLYEILLAARGNCFIALDVKDTAVVKDDILALETSIDALECSIYSMFLSSASGPSAGNTYTLLINYSKSHPEMTRFAEIIGKVETYMKMSGHAIRQRNWIDGSATTNGASESFNKYKTNYEAGKTLLYTNNIPLMSQFIAANCTPDLTT